MVGGGVLVEEEGSGVDGMKGEMGLGQMIEIVRHC